MTESSRYDSQQMRTVQRGITLFFYGLILSAAVFNPWLSALAINNVFGWTFELSLMTAAAQASLLLYAGVYIGSLICSYGMMICVTGSSEMPGKKAIYAAVSAGLIAHVIGLLWQFTSLPYLIRSGLGDQFFFSVELFPDIVLIAAFVCFLMFLQRLGQFLHADELTNESRALLKLGTLLIVMQSLGGDCFFPWVAACLGAIFFMRYVQLLVGFKKEVNPI